MEKVTLTVKGMNCEHCVNKVETALQNQNGVAKVKYDETLQTIDRLISEVKAAGYEAEAVK